MAIRIVRLGSPRTPHEGVRFGTVRRPPRGVRKTELASRDFYDAWLPLLAPSEALLKSRPAAGDDAKRWKAFARRYRAEMDRGDAARLLDALALLSQTANFAVGCYCADETRCHRSILRELLAARGAVVDPG